MSDLRRWYEQMVKLGEANIPMELEGQIQTPTEYMRKKGLL